MGLPLTLEELCGEEEGCELAHQDRPAGERCALHDYIDQRCKERQETRERSEEKQSRTNADLYDKYRDLLHQIAAATKSIEDKFSQEHQLLRDQIQRTSNKVVMIVAIGTGAAMALTLTKTLLDIYKTARPLIQ